MQITLYWKTVVRLEKGALSPFPVVIGWFRSMESPSHVSPHVNIAPIMTTSQTLSTPLLPLTFTNFLHVFVWPDIAPCRNFHSDLIYGRPPPLES